MQRRTERGQANLPNLETSHRIRERSALILPRIYALTGFPENQHNPLQVAKHLTTTFLIEFHESHFAT